MNEFLSAGMQGGDRLNEEQRLRMFAHILRLPILFSEAYERIKYDDLHLAQENGPFACLWQAVQNTAAVLDGKMPEHPEAARLAVAGELQRIAERPGDAWAAQAREFWLLPQNGEPARLDWIYNLPLEALHEELGRHLLNQFFTQLTVDNIRSYALHVRQPEPSNLDLFLGYLKRLGAPASGAEQALCNPFGDLEEMDIELVPTGVSFMDDLMEGGSARGEANIILGPSGGGKTTLGIQLAAEGSLVEQQRAQLAGRTQADYWFYVQYERPVNPEFMQRLWSYAAQVDYQTFRKRLPLSSSARGDFKSYELELWGAEINRGVVVAGEEERLAQAREKFNATNLWPFDFSGKFPGVGGGGIREIAAAVERQAAQGKTPAGVVIDYAGLCVERQIIAQGLDSREEFPRLSRFVNEVRTQIAEPFNCVVWILHQLHGDEGTKAPGARTHHSRARGSRNFADNASFAFEIGTLDELTGCVVIHKSKSRNADPLNNHTVVRFDGRIRRFTPANNLYAVNKMTRQIVDRSYLNAKAGTAPQQNRPDMMSDLRNRAAARIVRPADDEDA